MFLENDSTAQPAPTHLSDPLWAVLDMPDVKGWIAGCPKSCDSMQLWILILFSEMPRHLEKWMIFAKCLGFSWNAWFCRLHRYPSVHTICRLFVNFFILPFIYLGWHLYGDRDFTYYPIHKYGIQWLLGTLESILKHQFISMILCTNFHLYHIF